MARQRERGSQRKGTMETKKGRHVGSGREKRSQKKEWVRPEKKKDDDKERKG